MVSISYECTVWEFRYIWPCIFGHIFSPITGTLKGKEGRKMKKTLKRSVGREQRTMQLYSCGCNTCTGCSNCSGTPSWNYTENFNTKLGGTFTHNYTYNIS